MRARRALLLVCGCVAAEAAIACHSFDGFGPETVDAAGAPDAPHTSGADWSCLEAAPPAPNLPASVDVALQAIDTFRSIVTAGSTGGSDLDVVSATPLPGVSVQACPALDPTCAMPQTAAVETDDAGVARLTLPSDFDGVLQLQRADLLPGIVYLGRFVDVSPTYPVPMIGTQTAAALGARFGVTVADGPDAGLGHVFASVYDCNDRFAAGVTLQFSPMGPETRTFYNDTTTGLSTTDTATDTEGTGGALDVPAGDVTVTATMAADGGPFRSVKVSVASGRATLVLLRARTVP